jgi:hypothetical protein
MTIFPTGLIGKVTLKDLENDPEFSRKNVGKIQFTEEWYFDRSI